MKTIAPMLVMLGVLALGSAALTQSGVRAIFGVVCVIGGLVLIQLRRNAKTP